MSFIDEFLRGLMGGLPAGIQQQQYRDYQERLDEEERRRADAAKKAETEKTEAEAELDAQKAGVVEAWQNFLRGDYQKGTPLMAPVSTGQQYPDTGFWPGAGQPTTMQEIPTPEWAGTAVTGGYDMPQGQVPEYLMNALETNDYDTVMNMINIMSQTGTLMYEAPEEEIPDEFNFDQLMGAMGMQHQGAPMLQIAETLPEMGLTAEAEWVRENAEIASQLFEAKAPVPDIPSAYTIAPGSTRVTPYLGEGGDIQFQTFTAPERMEEPAYIEDLTTLSSIGGVPFYYSEDETNIFGNVSQGQGTSIQLGEAMNMVMPGLFQKYGITALSHIGSINERNIAGTDRPSEHSYGYALDIRGFQLADGRVLDYGQYDSYGPEDQAVLDGFYNDLNVSGFTMLHPPGDDNHIHMEVDPATGETPSEFRGRFGRGLPQEPEPPEVGGYETWTPEDRNHWWEQAGGSIDADGEPIPAIGMTDSATWTRAEFLRGQEQVAAPTAGGVANLEDYANDLLSQINAGAGSLTEALAVAQADLSPSDYDYVRGVLSGAEEVQEVQETNIDFVYNILLTSATSGEYELGEIIPYIEAYVENGMLTEDESHTVYAMLRSAMHDARGARGD